MIDVFMVRKLLVIAYYLSITSVSYSQNVVKLLKVGDQLPDIEFTGIYNYPGGRAKLSDFKGKLVILDFWNMGCAPCLKAFPKMQNLQEEFGDKIQILLVNVIDSKEYLNKLGFPYNTKSSYINQTKLPLAKENIGIPVDSYFEMATLPFHVWIGDNREIVAITRGEGTTRGQIENFIAGKPLDIHYQNNLTELGLNPDLGVNAKNFYRTILIPSSKAISDKLLYHFIITKNLDAKGVSGPIQDSLTGKTIGIRGSGDRLTIFRYIVLENLPILNFNRDRFLLEVDQPHDFLPPYPDEYEKVGEWYRDAIFTFECKYPGSKVPDNMLSNASFFRKAVQEEMERFFRVKVSVEKRIVDCRILIRNTDKKSIFSKGGTEYEQNDNRITKIVNRPFARLENNLREYFFNYHNKVHKPLLNETGFPIYPDAEGQYRFDMEIRLSSFDVMKTDLNKYGFDIIEAKREIEVMVIRDSN